MMNFSYGFLENNAITLSRLPRRKARRGSNSEFMKLTMVLESIAELRVALTRSWKSMRRLMDSMVSLSLRLPVARSSSTCDWISLSVFHLARRIMLARLVWYPEVVAYMQLLLPFLPEDLQNQVFVSVD